MPRVHSASSGPTQPHSKKSPLPQKAADTASRATPASWEHAGSWVLLRLSAWGERLTEARSEKCSGECHRICGQWVWHEGHEMQEKASPAHWARPEGWWQLLMSRTARHRGGGERKKPSSTPGAPASPVWHRGSSIARFHSVSPDYVRTCWQLWFLSNTLLFPTHICVWGKSTTCTGSAKEFRFSIQRIKIMGKMASCPRDGEADLPRWASHPLVTERGLAAGAPSRPRWPRLCSDPGRKPVEQGRRFH